MGASALGWPARCPAASRRPLPTHRITRVSSGRMGTAQQQQRGPGPAYPACCQEPHGQRVSVRAKTWPRCSGGGQPALGDGRLCTHLPFEEGRGQGQAGGGDGGPCSQLPPRGLDAGGQAGRAGGRPQTTRSEAEHSDPGTGWGQDNQHPRVGVGGGCSRQGPGSSQGRWVQPRWGAGRRGGAVRAVEDPRGLSRLPRSNGSAG